MNVNMFGADISTRDFAEPYSERVEGRGAKPPKGMDAAFADQATEDERRIKALIDRYDAAQVTKLEQGVFKQCARLAGAEQTLRGALRKRTNVPQPYCVIHRIDGLSLDLVFGRRSESSICTEPYASGHFRRLVYVYLNPDDFPHWPCAMLATAHSRSSSR